jgi:hypothetical protein
MKRYLMTLILSGFVGSLVLAGNAEACHKKRCACAPAPTCAVVEPAPCPPPAPVCEPVACAPKKKCGLFSCFKGIKLGHHKKACAEPCPAPAPCETVAYTATYTATYAVPVYAAPQTSAQH